jgi:hypothetical protein
MISYITKKKIIHIPWINNILFDIMYICNIIYTKPLSYLNTLLSEFNIMKEIKHIILLAMFRLSICIFLTVLYLFVGYL